MWHNYIDNEPQNADNVRMQCICYNSHVCIQVVPITMRYISKVNNMLTVNQLYCNKSNHFYEYLELSQDVKRQISWLLYSSIISVILPLWKFYIATPGLIDNSVAKYPAIMGLKKISGWVYKDMMNGDVTLCRVA